MMCARCPLVALRQSAWPVLLPLLPLVSLSAASSPTAGSAKEKATASGSPACLLQKSTRWLPPSAGVVATEKQASSAAGAATEPGSLRPPHGSVPAAASADGPAAWGELGKKSWLLVLAETAAVLANLDGKPPVLRVELYIQESLQVLQESFVGPIPHFLERLREVTAEALGVEAQRFRLLGIRGEDINLGLAELEDPRRLDAALAQLGVAGKPAPNVAVGHPASENGAKESSEEHATPAGAAGAQDGPALNVTRGSIVDLEVLPGATESDETPQALAKRWMDQLSDPDSALRTGPLGETLAGASLKIGGSAAVFGKAGAPLGPNLLLGAAVGLLLLQRLDC